MITETCIKYVHSSYHLQITIDNFTRYLLYLFFNIQSIYNNSPLYSAEIYHVKFVLVFVHELFDSLTLINVFTEGDN